MLPLVSTITRLFSSKRGLMMGIIVAGLDVGSLIITPLADFFLQHICWRFSFFILGGMALVLICGITKWFHAGVYLPANPDLPSALLVQSVVMPGLVADTFCLRSHGYLLGITNVFACAGCAIGPVLTGHLYGATGNYDSAIWIFAASGLASAVIASCLRSSHHD